MLDIYVDNDACPVKEEVLRVAERYALRVYLVSNQGGRPIRVPNVERVIVGPKFDAADDWIAEHIGASDIAVTADIQLAARCITKHANVLAPTGHLFTESNIGTALASRALNSYLREAGEVKGHNAAFSKQDSSRFLQALDGMIQKLKR